MAPRGRPAGGGVNHLKLRWLTPGWAKPRLRSPQAVERWTWLVIGAHAQLHGRSLLADTLSLVPDGEPVFAAVSPGNARSLRAFFACGFTPIGSEVLLRPERE